MKPEDRALVEREIRAQIVRRMRMRLGFNWHAAVFAMANAAMIAINLRFTPNTLWLAWGAGLMLHGYAVFSGPSVTEAEIQAQIHAEMARRGLS
jgi:hypothetical protein